MEPSTSRKNSIREVVIGPSCVSASPDDEKARRRFVEHLQGPFLRELFDHWNALRGDDGLAPLRRDISPRDLKEMLPFLTIWELVPEKGFAHVRLAGTRVTDLLMRETTGRTSIEAFPEEWTALFRANRTLFYEEQRPIWLHINLAPVGRGHIDVEFLMLPLRREGRKAGMGIGVFAPLAVP